MMMVMIMMMMMIMMMSMLMVMIMMMGNDSHDMKKVAMLCKNIPYLPTILPIIPRCIAQLTC